MPTTTATPPPATAQVFPLTGDGAGFAPRCELEAADLAGFDRDGFHIHAPLFSLDEVAAIRAACERVAHRSYASGVAPDWRAWEPELPRTELCKIDNSWKSDPLIEAAVTSPRLGKVAAQLIGAHGIRLWHDQYLRKPADGGAIVSWHQDWMYWQGIDRCRTVTCWIALCDVTVDMGPMIFLAGSQRSGLHLELQPSYHTGYELPPPPIDADLPRVPVVVRAGQVSFHHGNTMHASDCNRSGNERFSLVSHVMADDCCFREGQGHMCISKMAEYAEHPAPGERFRGPQFPYCWRASSF